MPRRKILIADLLCGAGGSTTGALRALDPIKVAWAAGVIEGEGSIQAGLRSGTSRHGKCIALRVRVVMTDPDILERLHDVFSVGRVLPYCNTQGLGKKQLYRWDASSRADVSMVCDAIYEWMGERRRSQIDKLRSLMAAHPPVTAAERLRRTWKTRHARRAGITDILEVEDHAE